MHAPVQPAGFTASSCRLRAVEASRAAARASARARILDAAVQLIAREGIDDVRIARIAMQAGVSASLLHYHFASRDTLLAEALEHSYELAGDIRTSRDEQPPTRRPSGCSG